MLLMLFLPWNVCSYAVLGVLLMLFSLWGVLFCYLTWKVCYIAIYAINAINDIFTLLFSLWSVLFYCFEMCAILLLMLFSFWLGRCDIMLSWEVYYLLFSFVTGGELFMLLLLLMLFSLCLGRRALLVLTLFVLFSLWGVLF